MSFSLETVDSVAASLLGRRAGAVCRAQQGCNIFVIGRAIGTTPTEDAQPETAVFPDEFIFAYRHAQRLCRIHGLFETAQLSSNTPKFVAAETRQRVALSEFLT